MTRYHRNSVFAFPRTTDYGCALIGPRPSFFRRLYRWLLRTAR